MKFRTVLTSVAAAAMVTFAAGAAGAATITDTFSFTATGFNAAFSGAAAPVDPVIGSVTITFDPTLSYFNQTAGIALNNINIGLDTNALSFDYSPTAVNFTDTDGSSGSLLAGELIIGGGASAALVQLSPTQNDFYVHVYTALTAPIIQQLGYTSSKLGQSNAYFYTPTTQPITVTPGGPAGPGGVPEPASWLLMIAGIGGVGAMLRRSKTASLANASI